MGWGQKKSLACQGFPTPGLEEYIGNLEFWVGMIGLNMAF